MLASDYVLQGAVTLLEKVRDGELRLDRTIEVSVTNAAEKKRIVRPVGARTWRRSTTCCGRTSATSASPSRERRTMPERREAWRRLVRRRHKAVRLVEELGLRTQRLQPLLEKLARDLARHGRAHREQLAELRQRRPPRRASRARAASCAT